MLHSFQTAWLSPNEEQFDALVKFLNKRLDEGHGETILEIGTGGKEKIIALSELSSLFYMLVADGDSPGLSTDEMDASVATLKSMQAILNAELQFLRDKQTGVNSRHIQEFLIRRNIDEEDFMEVR